MLHAQEKSESQNTEHVPSALPQAKLAVSLVGAKFRLRTAWCVGGQQGRFHGFSPDGFSAARREKLRRRQAGLQPEQEASKRGLSVMFRVQVQRNRQETGRELVLKCR